MDGEGRRFEFSGAVWVWRGPAPYYFVTVPEDVSQELKEIVRAVTYGWGMIPVTMRIGNTEWTTSLWPKDGLYIVPIKAKVRKAEGIDEDDEVRVEIVAGRETGA